MPTAGAACNGDAKCLTRFPPPTVSFYPIPSALCETACGALTEPRSGETRDAGSGAEVLVNRSGMIEAAAATGLTNGAKPAYSTFVPGFWSSIVAPSSLILSKNHALIQPCFLKTSAMFSPGAFGGFMPNNSYSTADLAAIEERYKWSQYSPDPASIHRTGVRCAPPARRGPAAAILARRARDPERALPAGSVRRLQRRSWPDDHPADAGD